MFYWEMSDYSWLSTWLDYEKLRKLIMHTIGCVCEGTSFQRWLNQGSSDLMKDEIIPWWVRNMALLGGGGKKEVAHWGHFLGGYILPGPLQIFSFCSASCLPWGKDAPPTYSHPHDLLLHNGPRNMEPSKHGLSPLKPWEKTNLSFCFLRYFGQNTTPQTTIRHCKKKFLIALKWNIKL